jgi:hypothetical protein
VDLIGSITQIDSHTVGMELNQGITKIGSVYVSANVPLRANPTALIPAFLPVAARLECDLHLEGALDVHTVHQSSAAVDLLTSWDSTLDNVALVDHDVVTTDRATNDGVACLASMGLDSFYSMNARRRDITHLVLCHGFDIGLGNENLWSQTVEACRTVAADEGKQLIELATNIKSLVDPYLSWTNQYHGAAIAVFGHLLDDHVSRVIVPSSYTWDDGIACGSHSRLDPLWSSARVRFEHHEPGVDRVQKLMTLGNNANAMRYLRPCVENLEIYNCGVCEKCIRTMTSAVAAEVDDRLISLPPVTPELIMGMPLRRPLAAQHHVENLRHLRNLPDAKRRPDLEGAITERLLQIGIVS